MPQHVIVEPDPRSRSSHLASKERQAGLLWGEQGYSEAYVVPTHI